MSGLNVIHRLVIRRKALELHTVVKINGDWYTKSTILAEGIDYSPATLKGIMRAERQKLAEHVGTFISKDAK